MSFCCCVDVPGLAAPSPLVIGALQLRKSALPQGHAV